MEILQLGFELGMAIALDAYFLFPKPIKQEGILLDSSPKIWYIIETVGEAKPPPLGENS